MDIRGGPSELIMSYALLKRTPVNFAVTRKGRSARIKAFIIGIERPIHEWQESSCYIVKLLALNEHRNEILIAEYNPENGTGRIR